MLLLVAIALITAQSVNLTLLLNEARRRNTTFYEGSAIARAVDNAGRARSDRGLARATNGEPGPVHSEITSGSPAAIPDVRDEALEARATQALVDAGAQVSKVRAGESVSDGRHLLIISLRLPDGRWLTTRNRGAPPNSRVIATLVGQTVVLLFALLFVVMLIGRRVTLPLKRLTTAAESFGSTGRHAVVCPDGPRDVQRLISAFNQMQSRILDMLQEKDRMLGAIGHDLRTPLASLRLRAETVDDDQEQQKMISSIDEMARTLDDILSLARLGRSSEEEVPVDLAALIEALAADLQDLGLTVDFEPGDRLIASVRPTLLRRAVRNLIENAVNYGGSAQIRLLRRTTFAEVQVDDHGPGIAPADLDRVMDGFVRLEESRNRGSGGTGLGLTIAKAIAHEHGGSLHLQNLDRGGLRAVMRLHVDPIS